MNHFRPRTDISPSLAATRDGIIAALTGLNQAERDRIATTWRHNLRALASDLLFIEQHQKTIAEADEMLTSTIRVHKPATVERARKLLLWRMSLYLEHLKAVSLAEARMDEAGIKFARSSDAWGQ